jgi:uncharacterized protein YndB with AHSA1/START domain
MAETSNGRVSVTRRIDAPASTVFDWLVDPARHPSFDGSGMLRDGAANDVVSAAGDIFVMKMHNDEMGDYEMRNHVVEYEVNRRIEWEPVMSAASRAEDRADIGNRAGHRWGYELEPDGPDCTIVTAIFDWTQAAEWLRTVIDDGTRWIEWMSLSLERLDEECTTRPPAAA